MAGASQLLGPSACTLSVVPLSFLPTDTRPSLPLSRPGEEALSMGSGSLTSKRKGSVGST